MASVKFEKCSQEWYMFQDYWRLCQKFWEPEDSDQYWDLANQEISMFMKKYENVQLSKELALTLNDFLDRKWRNGKEGA